MKIIINVDPRHEAELREFKAALERKARPTKGMPRVTLNVQLSGVIAELSLHRFNVEIADLPEPSIEPGDVVRQTTTGHWGRVLSSSRGRLSVKASRETLKETGNETFVCKAEDVEVLV